MIWVSLFYFTVACLTLVISSTLLIKSIENLSFFLKIKLFIISFFILGVGTSVPELFVGISSALMGNPDMSFSNLIGANFIDITLVIGLPIMVFHGIRVESKEERKDILYMFGCLLLPVILLFIGGQIGRIDGAILIIAFFLYNYKLLTEEKGFKKTLDVTYKRYMIIVYVLLAVISLVMLYYSSRWAVQSAINLAEQLKLSTILIGLVIISLGTTLPELVVSMQSMKREQKDLMVGNVIGSLVANSTLIVGIVALIHPITIPFMHLVLPLIFLVFAVITFMAFAEKGRVIGVSQGMVMVFLYIIFLIVQLAPRGLQG